MDGDEGAIILDEGGAGGGAEEVVEETTDQGGDGDEGGDEPGEREEEESRGGGRSAPVDVRKAIREIATQNPEFAKRFPKFEKDVTGALFTRQQVDQLGGLRTVSDTLEKLETFGGLEAIEEMSENVESSKELERGLERGDPAVMKGWATDYPDGFKRSVMPMFDQLEQLDPERSEQVSSAIISRVFEKFGVFGVVSELGKALSGITKIEELPNAIKHFNDLAKFLGEAKSLGNRAKSDPYASRSRELDAREQDLAKQDLSNFKSIVRSEVNTQITSEMNRQLREHLLGMKVFKVESGTANRMRKEINGELKRLVSEDSEYSRRYDSVMGSKDRDRAINFVIKAAFKRLPEAIKSVVRDYNLRPSGRPGGGGPKRQTPNNSGGGGNQNVVSGVPKTSDVDFGRTPMPTFLVQKRGHGQAYLKSGKVAKW